jgi:ABC-type uncharacterized transport system substrate-binding protein
MNRRSFIALIGGTAAWPLAARGQEAGRPYRLGFLTQLGRNTPGIVAFFDELRAHGVIEGRNLSMIPGGFGVAIERIGEVAETMVKAAPDAIVAGPELPLRALQTLTRTIPLIGMTEDMVAEGFAASLARPGGNITGISLLSPELDGKRQDILIEAVADANVTPARHLEALQDGARALGVELLAFEVATPEKIVPAIDEAKAAGAQALNFLASSLFFVHRRIAFERAAVVHLPAIYQWPEMAEEGGLVGYGSRFTEMYRQRAQMVVKILQGAKPADLPVEQPTRFELVINLKAAQAIGHGVPAGLVLRADKVIE